MCLCLLLKRQPNVHSSHCSPRPNVPMVPHGEITSRASSQKMDFSHKANYEYKTLLIQKWSVVDCIRCNDLKPRLFMSQRLSYMLRNRQPTWGIFKIYRLCISWREQMSLTMIHKYAIIYKYVFLSTNIELLTRRDLLRSHLYKRTMICTKECLFLNAYFIICENTS